MYVSTECVCVLNDYFTILYFDMYKTLDLLTI